MRVTKKNFYLKIPKHISVIYSRKKNVITFLGPLNKKSIKLKVQLFIIKSKNIIIISQFSFFSSSNNKRKKLKLIQGTTLAILKQLIIETSVSLHQKLKFIGVGYKVSALEDFNNKVLLFKLGYSHFIYFKVSLELKTFCLKSAKLFIYGSSYQNITQTAALIRSYKKPDPYRGKGILYTTETVELKEGKKV